MSADTDWATMASWKAQSLLTSIITLLLVVIGKFRFRKLSNYGDGVLSLSDAPTGWQTTGRKKFRLGLALVWDLENIFCRPDDWRPYYTCVVRT